MRKSVRCLFFCFLFVYLSDSYVHCHFFHCFCLVKNRKEAKRIALIDSLTASKARVEDLKMKVHDQRAKRDAYAAIISKQLSGISFHLFFFFFHCFVCVLCCYLTTLVIFC